MRKSFISLVLGVLIIWNVQGQKSADSARILYDEYLEARAEGDFARSRVILEGILEGEYKLGSYNQALVNVALGSVYYEMGHLDDSNEQYQIADKLLSTTDPRSLQLKISILINQGLLYNGFADYTNSLDYFSEAERLLRALPAWDSISYGKLSALLLNKGIASYHLGRYEEARGVLEESAQIKKARNHAYLGSVYFNLARVYQHLGDDELSRKNYLEGIEQWTIEYDSNYYELANIYLHFGQFLAGRGQAEEGLEYLQKALQNYRQNYGPEHPLTAACYERMAWYCMDQANYREALGYLDEALDAIETSSHDLTLLKILATKTLVLERIAQGEESQKQKTEHLEAALATNAESIEVLQGIQQAFLSAESRIHMISRQKELFTAGIRLNLEMFEITGKEEYTERAFLLAARGKSGELMFEIYSKEWLYLESLSDTMAMSATQLKQEIDHLSNLVQIEKMDMDPDSLQLAAWQNQLFQARDSFNRNMELLRKQFPGIDQFELNRTDKSVDEIQGNLKRNETLLEYYMTGTDDAVKEQLFIFIVTRNSCSFYRSEVDAVFHENLETIIDGLHGFVPYDESRARFDSLKLALFGVYEQILEPVEALLHTKNLLVVPDEKLSFIPFDALLSALPSEPIVNYAGLPYLLHEYNISYMYNSQLIKRKPSRAWRLPEVTAWIPAQSAIAGESFGQLEGAVEEVQEILEVFKGRSIEQGIGKRDVIGLLEENSILHLAMHSLATENSGISPYFILDPLEDPLLENRMHDYEINALNLTSPMVVLSSCETAGGYLQSGEGIMSLSRSFLQAGASSVVHTLWPVDDTKSRELMLAYYHEIKRGHAKSKALSRVKRRYLEQQPPFYTHPYYWAAFQVSGDTAPLQNRRNMALLTGAILVAFLLSYSLKRRSFFRRI